MALVQSLPNGHLVILLTPREAAMLADQILEPSDYPWQGSESQVVAFEVKERIRSALQTHLSLEVGVIGQMYMEKLTRQEEPEPEPDDEPDGDEDEGEPVPAAWPKFGS